MRKFSIVIPVYQNESNLPETISAVLEFCDSVDDFECEVVFVDDGSKDKSHEILVRAARHDSRIQVIKLTRNFGQIAAVLCGFKNATGDVVGLISADMQDPIQLFRKMLDEWKSGVKLAIATRINRSDGLLNDLLARTFHKMVKRFITSNYPEGGFDFCVIDRKLIQDVLKIEEKQGHLMLLILSLGYKYTAFPYKRKQRKHGKSGWSFAKKITTVYDTFLANTYLPIRFISAIGALTALFGFSYGAFTILMYIINYPESTQVSQGWSSIIVLLSFFSGIILLSLGIVGEYLWRTAQEVRKRPMFVEEKTTSFPSAPEKRIELLKPQTRVFS